MKKYSFIILSVVLFLMTSCQQQEDVTLIQPKIERSAIAMYINSFPDNVVKVIAVLSRSGYQEFRIDMVRTDSGMNASGSFENIPVGQWHLVVSAYDSTDTEQYSGETNINVIAGRVNIVDLELAPSNGNISINVTWGKPCVPVPEGIVGWWAGDGNLADLVNGNNGYFGFSYVQTFSKGYIDGAMSFDGSGYDRVLIPDAEPLKITGSLTIEAWIYPLSVPALLRGTNIVFRGDDKPEGLDPYSLGIVNIDSLQFRVESLSGYETVKAKISLDRWLHVAGVLDSTTGEMNLYVNGILKATKTTSIRPFRNLNPAYAPGLAIGNLQGTKFNYPYRGLIDEVSIYHRNLSQEEIHGIYTAGRSGKCKPVPVLF